MSLSFDDAPIMRLTRFGLLCRGWRIDLGILLFDQAKAMEMKPSRISGIEVGRIAPYEHELVAILQFFVGRGIDRAKWLYEDETPPTLPNPPDEGVNSPSCPASPPNGAPISTSST